MKTFNDLTGKLFGRLLVIGRIWDEEKKQHLWVCECQCENKTIRHLKTNPLTSGVTKSCGCYNNEQRIKRSFRHGMKKDVKTFRFYRIWQGIKARCSNKNTPQYNNYGGRGIEICEEWKDDFLNFKKDMFDSYFEHTSEFGEKNTSIDRIDNDGNYCKNNCKWSTREQQANNKSNNKFITYNDVTKTLSNWCREFNLNYSTVCNRINREGWSFEEAVELVDREEYQVHILRNLNMKTIYKNKQGDSFKIIEHLYKSEYGTDFYKIRFIETGSEKNINANALFNGSVVDDLKNLKYGKGYIGSGLNNSKHFLYSRWNAMLSKCYNINNKDYLKTLRDGITVCNDWLYFENYIKDISEMQNYNEEKFIDGKCIIKKDKNSNEYNKTSCYIFDKFTKINIE